MMIAVSLGVMAATTAVGMYSSSQAASAQNKAAGRAEANAQQRYNIENSQTVAMMEEQNNMATEKMTDISRAFLKEKGSMEAAFAESATGGNVKQRLRFDALSKSSELKGKVSKEINTNVVNIAQGMLASKIDTEAMISEARASRKNVFTSAIMGGLQGASQGMSLASGIKGLSGGSSMKGSSVNSVSANTYNPDDRMM